MAVIVKIEEFGEGSGIVLPKEVLAHLNAKAGDHLEFVTTPDGLLLKFCDAQFEEKMEAMRYVVDKNRDVLASLAKA